MTFHVSRAVERDLVRRIAAAASVFFFLDYDGTLSPLAPTPDEAVALPGTSALVRQLAAAPGVRVALVTGRPIADLRRFLDVPEIYYVGTHGLEVRLPNGEMQTAEGIEPVRAALPELRRRLQDSLGTRPGILIEDKGAALACHYRLAGSADAAAARKVIAALAHEHQHRGVPITLLYGHAVAEIRPTHLSKGKAACALLAEHAPSSLPVYVGDDRGDEDAFEMLPPDSITIRVAPARTATHARYRVGAPADVHRLLHGCLQARAPGVLPVDAEHRGGARSG